MMQNTMGKNGKKRKRKRRKKKGEEEEKKKVVGVDAPISIKGLFSIILK